jgi:uncharacterized membrane protein
MAVDVAPRDQATETAGRSGPSERLRPRASKVVWIGTAILCFAYGPLAINYFLHFFVSGTPALWDLLYSAVVGSTQSSGTGSVSVSQHQAYVDNRVSMLFHTVTGGGAIMIGVAQFSATIRHRAIRVHRLLGRVYVLLVLVAMTGAAVYLVNTGAQRTFDGPAFFTQLWALDLGTATTTILAVIAIRRRELAIHQGLMTMSLALMVTTPLLRVDWLIFGKIAPHATQATINLAAAASISAVSLGAAMIAIRVQDRRPRNAPATPLVTPRLAHGLVALSAVAAVFCVGRYMHDGLGVNSTLVASVLAWGLWLAVMLAMAARSRGRGEPTAAADWSGYALGLASVPIPLAIVWLGLSIPFTSGPAFGGAALIAPGIGASMAMLVALWRRRRAVVYGRAAEAASVELVERPLRESYAS